MIEIAGIPVAIVNNHNEALYPWYEHGIEDAVLLHVDGHSDMASQADVTEQIDKKYAEETGIANFICPAFHYGIVSSIYWLNPHSETHRLQDQGTRDRGNGRVSLETEVFDYKQNKELNGKRIRWVQEYWDSDIRKMQIQKINLEKRVMILDIDLDAFCCHKHVSNTTTPFDGVEYEGVENYEQRIDETMDFLRQLKAPVLITIARSQGTRSSALQKYVPMEKVDAVQEKTLAGLAAIYS